MTAEDLLNRMLERVPNTLDKRKGSAIYLALASVSEELALEIAELESINNSTYADTSIGDDLTRRAAERGINRDSATYAIRKGVFNIPIPIGSRFGLETTTYVVTEQLANNEAKLKCEQLGVVGNAYTGDLLPITFISGLTIASLTDILIPGEDEEDDESLRIRYYDNLESSSFGGNQADYKDKTKALPGIGGVKVYPVWNGGGTVKLVIIDSTFAKPSTILVDEIQTAIDPLINSGKGLGIAPIGHVVTVEGAAELIINITFTITLAPGYLWADIETYIHNAIDAYFLTLKKTWESEDYLVTRISQVESAVLQVTGVIDVTGTTLNSGLTNLILTDVQIPVLGTVSNI